MQQENNDNQQTSSAAIALGVLAGGVLGGVLALWLVPDWGRRTRERLRHLAAETRGRALGAADEVRDRLVDVIDQGRTLVEANRAAISSAYEAGREAFHRERERVQGAQPMSPSTPEGPVSAS